MTTTPNLIQRMKVARAKATKNIWLPDYCPEHYNGKVPDMIKTDKTSDVICTFSYHNAEDKENAEFICLAANEVHKLIEALEIAQEALAWIGESELSPDFRNDKEFMRILIEDCIVPKAQETMNKIEELLK